MKNILQKNKLHSEINPGLVWIVILSSIFVFFLYWVIKAAFKSFEMTDESAYFLMYEHPKIYNSLGNYGLSEYGLFVNKLIYWMNPGVIHYRLLRIIFDAVSTTLFYAGFWTFLKNLIPKSEFWNKISVFYFIAVGNLISYFVMLKSISHNSLNNFFLFSSAGLLLLYFAKTEKSCFKKYALIGAGFLAGFDFFIKFPSAVLFILLSSLLLIRNFKAFLMFYAGIVISFAVFFIFYIHPGELISQVQSSFSNLHKNHSFLIQIVKTIHSFKLFKEILGYFAFGFVFLLICLILVKFKKINPYKFNIFIWLSAGVFVYLFIKIVFYGLINAVNASLVFYVLFLYQFLLSVLFLKTDKPGCTNPEIKLIKVAVILGLIPLLATFGTGGAQTYQLYTHLMPLFGSFILLSVTLEHSSHSKFFTILILALVISVSIFHFKTLFILSPFKIPASLTEQKYEIKSIPKLKYIKVDYKSKKFLEEMQNLLILSGFSKNDYLIGFDIAGIVYLFDGISPGIPWYIGREYHSSFHSKIIQIQKKVILSHKKLFILLPEEKSNKNDKAADNMYKYLRENGLFNNSIFCGKLINPYIDGTHTRKDYPVLLFLQKF